MAGAAVIIPDSSDGTEPENPYGDQIYAFVGGSKC